MGQHVVSALGTYLDSALAPAAQASDIMSAEVRAIGEDWDLMKASLFLEEINHGGAPVVTPEGRLSGFLTLRDIMKGRRAGEMHAPVRGYMTRRVITARPGDTIAEIETLMFKNGIGHVPIIEDGQIRGLVTRTDFLRFVQASREEKRRAFEEATGERFRDTGR
jgi:tRNA nucleotidyltransferase (CCA-adding enzyme)